VAAVATRVVGDFVGVEAGGEVVDGAGLVGD
jgi:hypothetical protein